MSTMFTYMNISRYVSVHNRVRQYDVLVSIGKHFFLLIAESLFILRASTYVCMYVRVCVCVCVYANAYTQIHTYIHAYINEHSYIDVYEFLYIIHIICNICADRYECICTQVYFNRLICTFGYLDKNSLIRTK